MNQYIPCPRRKNGSRIHRDICKTKCPMKYYSKCKLNEGAYEELMKRYEQLKLDEWRSCHVGP